MPSKLKITLTCGDYEIVRPLKEGRVEADGIDLTMLCARRRATGIGGSIATPNATPANSISAAITWRAIAATRTSACRSSSIAASATASSSSMRRRASRKPPT